MEQREQGQVRRMKIYSNSYRSRLLRMKPTIQEEYKPEEVEENQTTKPLKRLSKEELLEIEAKRAKKREYQSGYRDRLVKELRNDPNSPRHGTNVIFTLSQKERCQCPKCKAFIAEHDEARRRQRRLYNREARARKKEQKQCK